MRAHTLTAFLVSGNLRFLFLVVLNSGGHDLIVLAQSVNDFGTPGASNSGSRGECLDKLANELKISEMPEFNGVHPGAAMETLASRASPDGHLRYAVPGPSVTAADMSASVQFLVTRHICSRLNVALDDLTGREEFAK